MRSLAWAQWVMEHREVLQNRQAPLQIRKNLLHYPIQTDALSTSVCKCVILYSPVRIHEFFAFPAFFAMGELLMNVSWNISLIMTHSILEFWNVAVSAWSNDKIAEGISEGQFTVLIFLRFQVGDERSDVELPDPNCTVEVRVAHTLHARIFHAFSKPQFRSANFLYQILRGHSYSLISEIKLIWNEHFIWIMMAWWWRWLGNCSSWESLQKTKQRVQCFSTAWVN